MYLQELAKIIYAEGTASENTGICVKSHSDKMTLWKGKAKELKEWGNIKNWIVVEILIDYEDEENPADYNKNKIITVI